MLASKVEASPKTSTPVKRHPYTVGSYLAVIVYGVKGDRKLFNGIIQDIHNGEYEVKFMERRGDNYIWPEKDGISVVPVYDFARLLYAPRLIERGRYVFVDFFF